MNKIYIICILLIFSCNTIFSQSEAYQKKKTKKIEKGSVFTKIIIRKAPATIVYEDKGIIAFVPLRLKAKVHLLIVPKKEIYTINDITEENTLMLGEMFVVAKKLAKEYGTSESG